MKKGTREHVAYIAYTACRILESHLPHRDYLQLNSEEKDAVLEQVDWIRRECRAGPKKLLEQRRRECEKDGLIYSYEEQQRDLLFASIVHILSV